MGGAALVSLVDQPVLTIDMRIDYLEAGADDLRAEVDIRRQDGTVGVVDIEVTDENGAAVADAPGRLQNQLNDRGPKRTEPRGRAEARSVSLVEEREKSGFEGRKSPIRR